MKAYTNTLAALAFAGFSASAAAQDASATVATLPGAAPVSKDIGISSRDGISVSGADTLVTRNGVTEKLSQELKLESGIRVEPSGTVVAADGGTFQLRPLQVLGFDGKLINGPILDGGAATVKATPERIDPVEARTTTTQPTQAPATPEATTKEAADIAAAEAQRRAAAAAAAGASASETK